MLNLSSDASYKQSKFFKILPEKNFKFISSRENSIITFNLSFVLLLVKVDLILKKKSCKENVFMACSTSCVKIIFTLLTKIIAFYIQAFILQVEIFDFEKASAKCKDCLKLVILLALDKWF